MKKTSKIIIVIIIIGIAALLVLKLSSNKKQVESRVYRPDTSARAIVQTDTIKGSNFDVATSFLGSFSPSREVKIASETSGKVVTVGIKEGSFVKTGSLVAQLDHGILQAQLNSAKANQDNAVNTLKRYQQAPTGVTDLQMDNARTQVLITQAQIAQLKKQIDQYTIKAPFNGIITTRNFDLGAIVSPGTPLANLINITTLKLEVSIPEIYISQFRDGMSMKVRTDVYRNTTFEGVVDYVSSNADASHNYTVKVLVTNKPATHLKSGMYGYVTLGSTPLQNAISIPRSSLLGSSQKPQIYVVENGLADLRDIEIGASNESSVQVTNGLKMGEIIITGGLVNLSNGMKVEIK